MTADNLTVAGRRFRTRADYEAALRDQKKINSIKAAVNFNDLQQIEQLFQELQSGRYRFETAVGNDFDDEIYEKIEQLKVQKKKAVPGKKASGGRMKQSSAGGRTQAKTTKFAADVKQKGTDKKIGKAADSKTASGKAIDGKASGKKKLEDYDKRMQKQILIELRKQEKRRKLIVVLASLVAVLCFGYFGVYYFYSGRTASRYEQLAGLKGSVALAESQSALPETNKFTLHKSSIKLPDVLEEYKTLYEKNKKLIGWLKIDDTIIDYPVMQTSNNEYYLDHNFNQEKDKNGSLFLDYQCSVYPRSTNMIIYGHHMKSGQMFGGLQKYAKESYGKEHAIIQFDSIYEKATYQVMYVFRSQVYNENDIIFKYYQFIEANSEAEFNAYMEEMAALSLYDTGVTAAYGDSLLTLSTCDSSQEDGRFVVVAKKIK